MNSEISESLFGHTSKRAKSNLNQARENTLAKLELVTIRKLRQKISLLTSIRNQIPAFLGVLIIVLLANYHKDLFQENTSEVVPFIYLFLRCSQNLVDVFRLSSYLRIEWPRIESYLKLAPGNNVLKENMSSRNIE